MTEQELSLMMANMLRGANLSAEATGGSIYGGHGIQGHGGVNLNLPIGDNNVGMSLQGGGINLPHQVKQFNVDRAGLNADIGQNHFSVDADPKDMRHNFMLNYKRDF